MNIQTYLSGDAERLFREELQKKNVTAYALTQLAIQEYLGRKPKSMVDAPGDPLQVGRTVLDDMDRKIREERNAV